MYDNLDIIESLRNDATTKAQTLAISIRDASRQVINNSLEDALSKIKDAGDASAAKVQALTIKAQSSSDLTKEYLNNSTAIIQNIAKSNNGHISITPNIDCTGLFLTIFEEGE